MGFWKNVIDSLKGGEPDSEVVERSSAEALENTVSSGNIYKTTNRQVVTRSGSGSSVVSSFSSGRGKSSDRVSKSWTPPSFHAIDTSIVGDVVVKVGDGDPEVTVVAEERVFEALKVQVRGKVLHLSTEGSFSTKAPVNVSILVPSLDDLTISGVGDVEVSGIKGKAFNLVKSGSGDTTLRGSADHFQVNFSGTGTLQAQNLKTTTVRIDASGIGDVRVRASERIEGTKSGIGNLTIYGDPRNRVRSSGIGTIDYR